MSTTYDVTSKDGTVLKSFSKKARAIDYFMSDSTRQSEAVVARPSGTVVFRDEAKAADLPESDSGSERVYSKALEAARKGKGTVLSTTEASEPVATEAEKREHRKAMIKAYRQKLMDRDPSEIEVPETKECRHCHVTKPADAFNKDLSIKDGLRQWCKQCYKEYAQRKSAERKAAVAAAAPVQSEADAS